MGVKATRRSTFVRRLLRSGYIPRYIRLALVAGLLTCACVVKHDQVPQHGASGIMKEAQPDHGTRCELAGRMSLREFAYWKATKVDADEGFDAALEICEASVEESIGDGIPDPKGAATALLRNQCMSTRGWRRQRLGCELMKQETLPNCVRYEGEILCAPGPAATRPQPIWFQKDNHDSAARFSRDHRKCLATSAVAGDWQRTESCMREAGWRPLLFDGLQTWPGLYTFGIAPTGQLPCIHTDGWIACPAVDLRNDPLTELAPFWFR